MTAPRECRPPEGTPDGTVFLLTNGQRSGYWRWNRRWLMPSFWSCDAAGMRVTTKMAADLGWRIAEPPHE